MKIMSYSPLLNRKFNSIITNAKYVLVILILLISANAFAQIGIGTKNPAASAALEVTSSTNNKGILIPRLSATQKDAIVSPAEGLLVYQTTAPIGFYYYTGGAWKLMAIQTDVASKVDKVAGKELSTNDYTTAEKTKLSAITGTNTGDQTTITGNAGTATKLATARNINGVAFDGSADITIAAAASAEQLTGTTLKSTVTGSSLTSVGTLGNLTVTNPIAGSVTGNAATATKLATTRNINGVAFDGSADITIAAAADAGTLSGTTLKSTVTGSSLTSVGTLGNLTVTNPIAGSVTGNAATATKLATARNINGVAFDGSADITIAAAAPTYSVGLNPALGGYVFYVTPDGKHGLVAETIDQLKATDFPLLSGFGPYAIAQDNIANPNKHSTAGANFSDWRFPSRYEMLLMYNTIGPGGTGANQNIGNFDASRYYLTTTFYDYRYLFYVDFSSGNSNSSQRYTIFPFSSIGDKDSVRAVRSF